MPMGLLGTKVGMTQFYGEDGKVTPVTVLQLGPCPVLQVRDQKRDGYDAIQIGFKDKPRSKATRAERGHVSNNLESKRRKARPAAEIPPKADCEPKRFIREFRLDAASTVAVGEVLDVVKIFTDIKAVDVIGTSKGRGTAGVIKKHNFGGMPGAHGAKKVHRQPGSTSSLASNRGSGRPKKGKKLAGRYGATQVTIRNLKVVQVDLENNVLLVEGAVPGYNGQYVMVRPTNKY
jgi:large subunit ribosomal protein L3